MTDTRKVQGWLDIFGDWDPTLAFVMAGAILPMAAAWRLTRNRRPLLDGSFPAKPDPRLGHNLVVGSVLFGAGWGLVGFCPGPVMASLGYGGTSAWICPCDACRHGRGAACPHSAGRDGCERLILRAMDIRRLSPDYAVSPQIAPNDVSAIRDAGFSTVICNRPDGEIPPPLRAEAMRQEVEAAGMTFVVNPVLPGRFTGEMLATQAEAMQAATGPVLAYCASGNRSAIVWSMLTAADLGVDAVLAATRSAGYDHSPFRAQFRAIAEDG